MKQLRIFLNTLGFMTRLAPARVVPEEEIFKSMPVMPLIGVVLGAVLALPWKLGLLAGQPWIQAWLLVILNAWLTRGLHYDGLSDIFDAVTAHTSRERFWEVVKDSRCGVFGVLALVLFVAGQLLLFHALLEARLYAAVGFVFVFGRFGCVSFGYFAKHLARPGLGKLLMDGATFNGSLLALLFTAAVGFYCLPLWSLLLCFGFLTATHYPLYNLAERVGGANGDFLGAAVMLAELAAMLAVVVLL
ncbi:adenosylcobinamide-GDP ribazoletransferase [Salidesulfovibrio onnuriiensis]|uniref:adenosylcobinamide-GDP ribazoletransferase n=1 Tax=Salidesulfovibrio onnuriiensis TaxID=2583823 RepID=UPI0011CA71EA|nr:adenosylcobinamide-GDP ribazoletransferase [Salidesulfovibrio onnuriiensis]